MLENVLHVENVTPEAYFFNIVEAQVVDEFGKYPISVKFRQVNGMNITEPYRKEPDFVI